MGFRTLAITYLLGGLTFLPLVFAGVLVSAWCLLPKVDPAKEGQRDELQEKKDGGNSEAVNEKEQSRSRQASTSDSGASGTFAVLRRYDFQTAIQALNARNNGGAASAGAGSDAASGDGGGGSSESVYQSMYRSVFPGNKNTGSNTSILENEDAQKTTTARRKPVPANVMHIVLRHGHLMLYDSPAQIEVKHVLSLAHHNVTLQSGKDAQDETDDRMIPEADLFIKRTAIVLTPIELPHGAMQNSTPQKPAKAIYLFSATSIEKEDFYHALLAARSCPPTLLSLDPEALIKLQSSLHSSSLTPETRALNALLGRIFVGIHHTDYVKRFILAKIERKLARIQKPTFIPLLQIRSLDLGDAAPIFTNLKLRDLNIAGDMTISADVRYNGGLSITLLAVAKLDLGARFKARTVDLILKASMQRVHGTMLLHIKPPPSNRMWYCFENMPELEVRAEPVVSERKITYGFVLRAIEERVKTALGEGLVKPNWDDIPMPLIDTRGSHARGGLWSDEGEDEHPELRPGSAKVLANRNGKAVSMPSSAPDMDIGTSTGLSSSSDVHLAKIRHAATVPIDERSLKRRPAGSAQNSLDPSPSLEPNSQSGPPPRPLRSPSITLPSPVVAVDGHTVEQVRADDPSLRPTTSQNRRLWLPGGSVSGPHQQKDAMDGLRNLRDRAEQAIAKPSTAVAAHAETNGRHSADDLSQDSDETPRSRPPSDSNVPVTPRSFSIRSTDSERSSGTSLSSVRGQGSGQKKAALLAAAGAATNAARNWGWNTYQKNKGMLPRTGTKQEASPQANNEPMGRGQPLPPPGQPLPGPNKGLWGGMTGMRRKPVPTLPPRRPRTDEAEPSQTPPSSKIPVLSRTKSDNSQNPEAGGEDEFGTWQENVAAEDFGSSGASSESLNVESGKPATSTVQDQTSAGMAEEEDLLQLSADETDAPRTDNADEEGTPSRPKKVPPPLPTRRQPTTDDKEASEGNSYREDSSKDDESDGTSDASALRVPEGAADAVAAENSTVALEIGAKDDQEHLDKAHAVETEVRPEPSHDGKIIDDDVQAPESDDAHLKEPVGRKRANTAEKFRRGEDLNEEDFEQEKPTQSVREPQSTEMVTKSVEISQPSTSPAATNEADDVSERIKAQVQRHRKETTFTGGEN